MILKMRFRPESGVFLAQNEKRLATPTSQSSNMHALNARWLRNGFVRSYFSSGTTSSQQSSGSFTK